MRRGRKDRQTETDKKVTEMGRKRTKQPSLQLTKLKVTRLPRTRRTHEGTPHRTGITYSRFTYSSSLQFRVTRVVILILTMASYNKSMYKLFHIRNEK